MPKRTSAVLIKGGLHRLSDVLNRFPEEGNKLLLTSVTVVEEVHGVEPIKVGEDLLFASTKPARLEVLFGLATVLYAPHNGTYVRQVHKRWLRKYVELRPLNPGIVNILPRLLEARIPLIEIKPPNEVYISDYYTSIRLIFGEDGRLASKAGQLPLTWFSNERNPIRELLQSTR